MDNRLILIGLVGFLFLVAGCSQEDPYEIVGDSVMINDSYLYMNVSPHTISNSDWVELEFQSKVFSGDIDFVFGFNTTDGVYPTEADRWNPHIENVTVSYTCLYDFNYTTNPNHFWCWNEEGLIFDHSFEGGDLGTKTAWWTELQENNWTDWQPENSIEYDFLGMDKWYYTTGQPINAGQTYKIRYYLEMPMGASGKYTLAIKPSSETIEEAIANEHLWYLDPWYTYSSLDTNIVAYYSFDDGDLIGDKTAQGRNLTINTSGSALVRNNGILNQTYNNTESGANADFLEMRHNYTMGTAFSWSFWGQYKDEGLQKEIMGNDSNSLNLLCNKDNGDVIVYRNKTVVVLTASNTNCESPNWVHYVLTYDGVNLKFYFGNSTDMVNTTSAFTEDLGTVTNLYFYNADPRRSNDAWTNGIDEVGLWNKTLSADEVGYLWNTGSGLYYQPINPNPVANISVFNHTIYPSTAYFNSTLNCSARVVTNYASLYNITFNWTNSSGFVQQTVFNEVANDTYSSTNQTTANPLVQSDVWNCTVDAVETGNASVFNITSTTKTISNYPPVWVDRPTNTTRYNGANFTLDFNCTNPEGDPSYYIRNLTRNIDNPVTINVSNGLIEVDPTYNDTQTFNYNVTCLFGSSNITSILNISLNQSIIYNQPVDITPISEGNQQTFRLNLGITNHSVASPGTPVLQYNGSNYLATTTTSGTSGNTNFWNWTRTLNIPSGHGTATGINQTYNWTFNVTNALTSFETNSSNFTILSVDMDNCTSYTEEILNVSLFDEENNTVIWGDIEIEAIMTSWENSSISWNFSQIFVNVSNFTVCVPSNVLINNSYQFDVTMQYDSTNRVTEFWHLDYGNLSNSSLLNSYTTKIINLMNLATADSTSFLFSYFNENGVEEDDVIVNTFRKYIGEALFREVERSKQDDNGDTIVHLVEEDVIYYFTITQNGTILFTSTQFTAICQEVPCEIELEASDDYIPIDDDNFDSVPDGWYSLSTDENARQVTMTFSASNTSNWSMEIWRYSNNPSDATLVNSSSLQSSSGTIVLGIPQVAGNITFVARVKRDSNFIADSFIDMVDDLLDEFRTAGGIVLGALIPLTLGLMAVSSGIGVIIFFIMGVVASGLLKLFNFNWSAFISILVLGGLLIWKLMQKK